MSSVAVSETSSAAASEAGCPAPSTPPTSPSKTTPPSSPKKAAAAAKRGETKRLKELEKQKAKDSKWRSVQIDKIEKTLEKKKMAAKALLDKLSTGWDAYALAVYQKKLLETKQVQSTTELEAKTKAYEEGDQLLEDFQAWIVGHYSEKANDDDMQVDELEDDEDE